MPQRYELSLWDYWRVIRKRKWIILLAFLAVLIPSIVYTRFQVPVYTAAATVKYIQRKTALTLLTEMFTYSAADPMVTQSRVARSSAVVEKVVKRLRLVKPDATDEEISRKVASIRDIIFTEIVPNTDLIKIKVTHTDPNLPVQIANATAEAYIEVNLEEKSSKARRTREITEQRLKEIEIRLRTAKDKLSRFRSDFEVTGVALPDYNLLQELRRRRQALLAGPERLSAEVVKLNKKIDALENRSDSLLVKYTEKHPEVVSVRQQIDELKAERERLLIKHQEEGDPELKRLDEQIALLQEKLEGYPEHEIELASLDHEVKLNTDIYSDLRQKLTRADIEYEEQVSDVTLPDRALESIPSRLDTTKNYLIGGLIGLMIGLAFAFIIEHLDTSIRTIEEVEEYLKLPVLGVIPHIESPRPRMPSGLFSHPFLITQLEPRSAPAEAYRALRTALLLTAGEKKKQTWLFVSAAEREGKSITALNTAVTLAQAGHKTCLVDADLRGPVLHRALGLARGPGLADFLMGKSTYGDAIRGITDFLSGTLPSERLLEPSGLQHLYFIPPGSRVRNPTELISSQRMTNLIQRLKSDFEAILFDTCPVIPVTDAMVLASLIGQVVLVHQIGRIARGILARTKNQLETTKTKILGVVLNNLKPAEMESGLPYYYYYRSRYYRYGYGEQEKVKG